MIIIEKKIEQKFAELNSAQLSSTQLSSTQHSSALNLIISLLFKYFLLILLSFKSGEF